MSGPSESTTEEVRICPNCGAPAPGRFCASCGQEQSDRLVSAGRMMRDLLEDSFSLESRLPRTVLGLLFRPGFLTREYIAGRIARYIHPFRLYVVATLVFFLVLSLVADFDRLWRVIGPDVEAAPDDSYALVRFHLEPETAPAFLRPAARALARQEAKVNALGRREGVRVLYDATLGAVPPIVFALVPLFALVLKGLYRRRLFAEHAVFVLHLHALGFLLAALAALTRHAFVGLAVLVWIAVWLYLALRRVYGGDESTPRTLLKYVALVVAYLLAFGVTVSAVMIAAVMSV